MDDLTDDGKTSDIPAFNLNKEWNWKTSHKELEEGHPELMNSGEDLIDIQSEDGDKD